ncbi:bZIP transcription factor [Arcanobacterium urinimassiliense]|uniref:bZIP transcription factor n=1 Tax=Arcanobacterium urinimassiliense TaxID=1871014 RepID=UPI00093F335E|nr:bZIP transcription factor [Arcanobacterium urinimassiliense]
MENSNIESYRDLDNVPQNPLLGTRDRRYRTKPLDVRINTEIITDPKYRGLTSEAFAGFVWLLITALSLRTDGYIPRKYYDIDENASKYVTGIPYAIPEVMDDLEEAGLIVRESHGLYVSWEWQTTEAERARKRENNRTAQQAYRNRNKAKQEEQES